MSDRVTRIIMQHEGLRLRPYRDTVGKLTIGVGRNLDDNGITEAEAALMLSHDLAWVEAALNKNVPWWCELSEVRQAVMISMCFNLGWPRFSGFRQMLFATQRGDYDTAADEMLDSRWASQVGIRAKELSDMMRHDEWPEGV